MSRSWGAFTFLIVLLRSFTTTIPLYVQQSLIFCAAFNFLVWYAIAARRWVRSSLMNTCVLSVEFARGRRSRAVAPCGSARSPAVREAALLCPVKGLGDAIVQYPQEPAEVRMTFRCLLSGALCRRWFPLVTRRGSVFSSSAVWNTALGGLVRLQAHSPSSRNFRLFRPFSLSVVSDRRCSQSAILAVPPVREGRPTGHF